MSFQSTVVRLLGFGIVGEFFLDGLQSVQPAILDSTDAANNVFGRAFTVSGNPEVGGALLAEAGGTGPFAGILINPKTHISYGTDAGGPLAPSMVLPNEAGVELCKGTAGIIVSFAGAAAIGDWVEFVQATGVLAPLAPEAAASVGSTIIAGARVERYDLASGLAVISLTPNATPFTAPA